ncbi:hypothetical protein MLD52_13385 [Puniceicoccaceae bacterium K14]|nr:hypothetical protein [Puniceicoccaceae bacterium K14]
MAKEAHKFGTFSGVFVPNVLTILGVIMFLRSGWVVGQAGLTNAIIMLCIANLVTLVSSLSMSAIATNTKAQGGGAYYLISRSLGLEFGGSIGMPLFLAQAISVAFYVVGFTESVQYLFPEIDSRLFSIGTLGALFVVAWFGAGLAIKAQLLILVTLGLSLLSFFGGLSVREDWGTNLSSGYLENQGFWTVFAIFFPAVTGIMSGVSMSGDLKDPSRSIPKGTIYAVIFTFFVYLAQLIWLALSFDRETLLTDSLAMKQIALVPGLILAGLWAATLSSALASLVAAPRTMQALAKDRVLPRFLAKGHGPANEPRLALIASSLIALVCVALGDLNIIAPLISMFFLSTYGAVNLVAAVESWTGDPSYRPTFKTHWVLSLIGALACFAIMILLSPLATVLSAFIILSTYTILARRVYKTAWGDARSGFWFSMARMGLLKFASSREHTRNWRPAILVLMSNLKNSDSLLDAARYLEANRGVLFLAHILLGDWKELSKRQRSLTRLTDEKILDERMSAFTKVVVSSDFEEGISTLIQATGLGKLKPNTLLIEWGSGWLRDSDFGRTVHQALEMETNLLVFSKAKLPENQLYSNIDVWWSARANGAMMLTLAYLVQGNRRWRDARIRILRIIRDEKGRDAADDAFKGLLKDSRIEADTEIIVGSEPPLEIIARESGLSSVTFVGVSVRTLEEEAGPLSSYEGIVEKMQGQVFLTKNWHDLEF